MTDFGSLLGKGVDALGDGVDSAKKAIGHGVDMATEGIGAGLDYVGAHDWADEVEDFGDDVAHGLGAMPEKQLGQTQQAAELLHGKPDAIWESAAHLKDFQAAFDRVGQGMKALDSGHWKGAAADAFREKFAMHPTDWFHAADACEVAGNALGGYAETVVWAQLQAQSAIELYRQGMKASKEAADAYKTRAEAYKAAVKAGQDPGPCPAPGADPGEAARARAREILDEARHQRDDAARTVDRAIAAATEHAPAKPSAARQIMAEFMDYEGSQAVELTHVLGGAVKGTAGILNFARGLNPGDPYNLTHPAEHQQHVNMTLAGLVSTAAHPERVPAGLIESLKGDFSEGVGRLFPEFVGPKGIGAGARTGRVTAGKHPGEAMATRKDWRAWNSPKSTKPVSPEIPADSYMATGDPVYHRQGSTAIGYDSSTLVNFDLVKPKPGYHDVVIHGNNGGYFEPGRVNAAGKGFSAGDTSPAHIAEAIRNNPHYDGAPIRLISCHTGTIRPELTEVAAAQSVANQLGVPVRAPTNKVGVSRELGPGQEPEIFDGGYWRTFLPIAQ
ncbi:putative T7SS-secreted protein [Streptomyces avidinii]|uniref:putative T7SS-secreted protein n=1 Tax=Streptomyces avidinii TaxID=1895 RepID=UPI0037A86733